MTWNHYSMTFSSKYGDRRIRRSRNDYRMKNWQAILRADNILFGQDLTAEER